MNKHILLKWMLTASLVVLLGSNNVTCQDTLYTSSDPVIQLTTATFQSTVLGSKVAWAVEFYSTWCGHCQRFAPVWVSFAESVKGWDSVVRVAAIACSDPKNAPTCRHHNIWGYPTVKFYPKNASNFHKGNPYNGDKSPQGLRNAVLDYISASREKPRIHLQPLRSMSEIQDLKKPSTHSVFLIAVADGKQNKYTAQSVILDLSSHYPQVLVVWSTANVLKPHGMTDYPGVYRVTNDSINKVQSKGELVSIITRESLRSSTTSSTWSSSASTTASTAVTTIGSPSPTIPYIPPDGLHSQDLESALYYSFWVEVAAQRQMSRPAVKALQAHVNVLKKYLPANPRIIRFLKRVHHWLKSVNGNLTGTEWVANITNLQRSNAFVPQKTIWTGCKGTTEKYRGYPCGLWMTYHSLTVNAFLYNGTCKVICTKEVLQTMAGYIKYFFGCRNCAQHFARLAADIDGDVDTESDGVLWLWSTHNDVNHRLHGDATEDPRHPKIQFPSPKVCTECRLTAGGKFNPVVTWNDRQTLAYLLAFYRKENLIQDSEPSKFEKPKGIKWCVPRSTKWNSCSKTCGAGVSIRLSNSNPDCKMKLEFRLCQIRPCNIKIKDQGELADLCNSNGYTTVQTARKTLLTYGNCQSTTGHIWRYCATCGNKCCRPVSEKTVTISMVCRENRKTYPFTANVMKINHCRCDRNC